MTWPGIPEGRGNTCAEEGCGNPRRPRGNYCTACYYRRYRAHRRSAGQDLSHSWSEGGVEVPMTRKIRREMDEKAFSEWQSRQM